MILDRAGIARLIPHGGAMCLLHEVLDATRDAIRCRAVNHRDPSHPLRLEARLPAVCGIEYAAQAMAVHGAIQGGSAWTGVLAALRDVRLHVARLDDLADDILVAAHRLSSGGAGLIYEFEIRAGELELLHGRATVVPAARTTA